MVLSIIHPQSIILSEVLAALGHGTIPTITSVKDWPIYCGDMPTSPDNLIRINDIQGRNSGRIMNSGEMIDYQGIQVTVRARRYDDAMTKANAISDAFDLTIYKYHITLSSPSASYILDSVKRTSDPVFVGKGLSSKGRTVSDHTLLAFNALLCFVEG